MLVPIINSTKISPSFFISLGVGYFIASNGMSSMIVASNMIYGISDSGFLKRRFKAIIMEIVIVLLFLFVLFVPLLGNNIISFLHYLNLDVETTELVVGILRFLKGPFSWLVIFIFVKLLYTMAPDKRIPSRHVNIGAVFTTLGWVISTMIYSYYINHYANYSIFYGALANIVILMLWVYLLSYIFVLGLAMNYDEELEKTGVLDVKKIIEASADIANVFPHEEKKKTKKGLFKRKEKKKEESKEKK
jgi:membrane protein